MEIISLSGIHPAAADSLPFVQLDDAIEPDAQVAVKVSPDTHQDAYKHLLQQIRLLDIQVDNFMDGRVFTYVVRLRRDYGFKGEIRVTGPLMPDQAHMLKRTGVDSIKIPDIKRRDAFLAALTRFGRYYQNSIQDDDAIVFERHKPFERKAAS